MSRRRSELEHLFIGRKLGEGTARKVYALKDPWSWTTHNETGAPINDDRNPSFVVKFEKTERGAFQNAQEWAVWKWVRGTTMEKWFAPCEAISPCGMYLIQRRVEPLRANELPKKLPAFLQDIQQENFGRLGEKIVCCDYGTNVAAIRSSNKRLVKVDWI